jgi:hypothetical protein
MARDRVQRWRQRWLATGDCEMTVEMRLSDLARSALPQRLFAVIVTILRKRAKSFLALAFRSLAVVAGIAKVMG